MVEFRHETDDRLWEHLTGQIPELDPATPAQREQLLRLTRALLERPLPDSFILSGIRATAGVIYELDAPAPSDDVMQREEVRRFIAENAVTVERRKRLEPPRETRRLERERLLHFATAAIRDARSAKARHEIKKTRRVLMRIDQRELRRVLGKEAEDLCQQINALLRARAALF